MRASIYNKIIEAKTYTELKRKASIEANQRNNPHDIMYVEIIKGAEPLTVVRYNKKMPNNTIIHGQW